MDPFLWNAFSYNNGLWVETTSLKGILIFIHELEFSLFYWQPWISWTWKQSPGSCPSQYLRLLTPLIQNGRYTYIQILMRLWNKTPWDKAQPAPKCSISVLWLLSMAPELALTQWHSSGAVLLWCCRQMHLWEKHNRNLSSFTTTMKTYSTNQVTMSFASLQRKLNLSYLS